MKGLAQQHVRASDFKQSVLQVQCFEIVLGRRFGKGSFEFFGKLSIESKRSGQVGFIHKKSVADQVFECLFEAFFISILMEETEANALVGKANLMR